jgi:hypothetical protein
MLMVKNCPIFTRVISQNILDSIVLEVDFEKEHPNNTIKYDIFMTSDNEAVYKLSYRALSLPNGIKESSYS